MFFSFKLGCVSDSSEHSDFVIIHAMLPPLPLSPSSHHLVLVELQKAAKCRLLWNFCFSFPPPPQPPPPQKLFCWLQTHNAALITVVLPTWLLSTVSMWMLRISCPQHFDVSLATLKLYVKKKKKQHPHKQPLSQSTSHLFIYLCLKHVSILYGTPARSRYWIDEAERDSIQSESLGCFGFQFVFHPRVFVFYFDVENAKTVEKARLGMETKTKTKTINIRQDGEAKWTHVDEGRPGPRPNSAVCVLTTRA